MKHIINIILTLIIISCGNSNNRESSSSNDSSNSSNETSTNWKYSFEKDEMEEQTIFKGRIYSNTNPRLEFPYSDASYFLEVKIYIPDYIKTYPEFISYKSGKALINIKCTNCPSGSWSKKDLKYKFDENKPSDYVGYNAEEDNDGLRKYAFNPYIGTDNFLESLKRHKLLKLEVSKSGGGKIKLDFDIKGFDILDVIQRNHFPQYTNNATNSTNKESQNEIINESVVENFYIIAVDIASSDEEALKKVNSLKSKGYNSDYLWIPDYKSLSGAEYFSVFIGPFTTIDDCAFSVQEYRKENPSAYGLLVSNESSKRVEIRGPNRISTK